MFTNLNLKALGVKTASLTLAVSLFLSPFTNTALAFSFDSEQGLVFVSPVSNTSLTNVGVGLESGAMTHSVDIVLPPGRNGLAPQFGLTYSSQNTGPGSHVGHGWSLSVPEITRINKSGIDTLYSVDTYQSSLDGELVETSPGTYVPKVNTSFNSYQLANNVWTVTTKSGDTYLFGSTAQARVHDPADTSRVYTWKLEQHENANGDQVVYAYHRDQNELYIDAIEYGKNGTSFLYEVNFSREARPDIHTSYETGFLRTTAYRINEIEVLVAGTWERTYDLGYVAGENSARSLLSSVDETAKDATGQTVTRQETYTYSDIAAADQTWSVDNSVSVPEKFMRHYENFDDGVRQFDVNGDGLVDIVRYWGADLYDTWSTQYDPQQAIYLNDGSGWNVDTTWTLPQPITDRMAFSGVDPNWARLNDMGARFADVNGDGFTDIIWAAKVNGHGGPNSLTINYDLDKVYLNNQVDGWDESTAYQIPSDIRFQLNYKSQGVALADINGDRLPDLIKSTHSVLNNVVTTVEKVYFNTGSGWSAASSIWYVPEPILKQSADAGSRFVDINGDGLTDFVRHLDSDYATEVDVVYFNTGAGWSQASAAWNVPVPIVVQNYPAGAKTLNTQFIDVNSDGLVDLLANNDTLSSAYDKVYINTGSGWSDQTTNWSGYPLLQDSYSNGGGSWFYDLGVRSFDYNGDNMVDFVKYGPTTHPVNNDVETVYQHQGSVPDLLESITHHEGGTTDVEYSQSADATDNPDLPYVLNVVSQITTDSGFSTNSETYKYQAGSVYHQASDVADRRFAGFGQVTKTTDLNKETAWYHQGNGDDTASGEVGDAEALIGQSYRTEITDLADNLYTHTQTDYDTHDLGNDSTFVKLASQVTLDYDGDSDEKAAATSYTYDNTHGSVLTITEHGEVNAASNGTWSDSGSDDRSTEYTYATGGSLVLPATETIKDDSGSKVAETRYYYDNLTLGSVTTGNLTTQEGWVSGSTYVDQTYTYDSFGNVLSETDGEGNVTTYAYDAHNLYPASVTNDLSQTTSYQYDYRTGQVGTTTDANGEVFVTTYDGFGRPTSETIPDPQTGNSVTRTTWTYTDTPGAVAVAQTNHLTSALTNTRHTYLDGFGQVIQERAQSEGDHAVRDFAYGDNGLLETETLPYLSAGSARTTATTNTDLESTYTYDALGRVTNVATVVGNTGTSYDQWQETVTDTAGVDKDFEYDAYGRLVTVTEHEGSSTFDTEYTYDSLNNLTLITDALGNERGVAYDGLSRRTSLEDLHDPSDSTFGIWTFVYDDASNLTSQTDPNSQTINWTYDDLNRQLTEDYTGASGTEITYTYDSCTNGIGRLCSAANADVTTAYTYTDNGLVDSESKTVDSTTYTSSYDYDWQGNQTELTYPNGAAAQFAYNTAGMVESVDEKLSGGSFATLITDIDYGPHGKETYIERASGIASTYTFDATELYRLSNIDTSPGIGGPGAELVALEAELFATTVAELPATTTVPTTETAAATTSTTTEATEVPTVTEPIASTTDVVFAVATSTATGTEPAIELSVAKTTEAVTKEVLKEVVRNERAERLAGKKAKIKLNLENRQQARVLQKYHRERVAGMKALGMEGTEAYEAAMYAYDQAELALTEDKHLDRPGEDVSTPASEWATEKARKLGKSLEEFIKPTEAGAYLFNTEDFESCSTLPCSFDNLASWGSVTPSIDTGSQVAGSNSLQETVTGSGAGALELLNQNEDEVYVQFKVFIPSNMTWGSSGYYSLLRLEDAADGTIFSMALENWGDARLTVNGDVLPWTNTGVNLTKGAVNTVEVRFKKGTTDGAVDIWVDNTTEGSPNYSSGNVNTGTDNVDDIHVGVTYAPEAISTTYYDDAVIDTIFIGSLSGGLPGEETPVTQEIAYTYDSVGNITQIDDSSDSATEAYTSYEYDDLNRLTRANQTAGSDGSYDRTYAYNEIGNITNKHGTAYVYDGLGGGGSTPTSIVFYDDAIASGLSNWSWDVVIDPSDTSPVNAGTYAMELAYPAAWDGLYLHNPSVDLANIDSLDLSLNVNSSTGVEFYLYFQDASYNTLTIVPLSGYVSGGFQANTWHDISVPLSALGLTQSYTGAINLVIESGGAATINVDDLQFVGSVSGGGGSSATNANPHAATQIGNTTYTYDDNGNLLTSSDGLANTWNYRNELIESGDGQATTTFTYDHTGQRIKKTAPDNTVSYYPFGHYEVRDGDISTHIYLGGRLAATREAGTITDVHTDHLGSIHTVTNEHARLDQAIGYYPYGEVRNEGTFSTTDNQNRYTGHDYDVETNLNYMNARYQDGETARFLSQDPLFITIGSASLLTNPQRMNSYGYALNNPIVYNDPTGESASFSNFLGFTVPRVDNLSGGYVANDTAAKQQGAVQVGQAATYTGAGVTGIAAVGIGLRVAPALTIGAVSNMGVGAYEDYATDGVINDGYGEYVTRGAIGAAAGQLAGGRGLLGVAGIAASESALTQHTTGDRRINGREVAVDTGVAVGLRGGQSLVTPSSQTAAHGSFGGSLSQLVTELGAKVAAFEAIVWGNEQEDSDTDHD